MFLPHTACSLRPGCRRSCIRQAGCVVCGLGLCLWPHPGTTYLPHSSQALMRSGCRPHQHPRMALLPLRCPPYMDLLHQEAPSVTDARCTPEFRDQTRISQEASQSKKGDKQKQDGNTSPRLQHLCLWTRVLEQPKHVHHRTRSCTES